MVAKTHLLVGEELMMVERVALVYRAQPLDVHRPVPDASVHCPLEQIAEQESEWDGDPLERGHIVDVIDVDVERRRAHGVDDRHVEVAVVPSHDAGAILLPEFDLSLADHPRFSCAGWKLPFVVTSKRHLIYHTSITLRAGLQSRPRRGAVEFRRRSAPPPGPWRPAPAARQRRSRPAR